MQIEIKIDGAYKEPKIVIFTDKITDEINGIADRISAVSPQILCGFRGDTLEVLEQSDILRIYSLNGKVFAATVKGEYKLRLRLYELEERIDKKQFVRISKSEIINLKRVKNFDLSFTGAICVLMSDESVTYVSRRYVTKLKQILGL